MDEIIQEFKLNFGIFYKLRLYKDKVVINKLFSKKVIPVQKIANVSYNKLTGRVFIETSGGEKTVIRSFIFGSWHNPEKIQEAILALIK